MKENRERIEEELEEMSAIYEEQVEKRRRLYAEYQAAEREEESLRREIKRLRKRLENLEA